MKKPKSYEDAMTELVTIQEELENQQVSVDELTLKVKRANELIAFCQQKLHTTEDEVKKIMGDFS